MENTMENKMESTRGYVDKTVPEYEEWLGEVERAAAGGDEGARLILEQEREEDEEIERMLTS